MTANPKKSVSQREHGFTLIELIMVIVIIGILVLVALPRYYANVAKATKAQIMANLDSIRQVQLAYYATYGAYKASLPITVVLDGETIAQVGNPSNSAWSYGTGQSAVENCLPQPRWYVNATKQSGTSCQYWMCVPSGDMTGGTSCTP